MRLQPHEVSAIKDCAHAHFGAQAIVRLFGSRVRDDLRGGDIDLHIVAEDAVRADFAAEVGFKQDLMARIGEQRVDVVLKAPEEPLDSFDRIALATSIVL